MNSFIKSFNIDGYNAIKELYNNLIQKGKIELQKFYSESNNIIQIHINYIFNVINLYIQAQKNLFENKKEGEEKKIYNNGAIRNIKLIMRKINYLSTNIVSKKLLNKFSLKFKLSNRNCTAKLLILTYIILFYIQNHLKNYNIDSKEKYLIIKILYNFLGIVSNIISKLYFDKILTLDELEIILKSLILFSINDYKNKNIKENNNIENIMYLKTCIKIIKIIYSFNSSLDEKNLLIRIFQYINSNICYTDIKNININYTNKFYMINNDYKTTKLLSLMNLIHKIYNQKLSSIYFSLLINIYCFQFNYNNFNYQFYKLFEPLLINIDKKTYSEILNEISFPEFQLNFLKDLINKERILLENNSCLLSNGFYLDENNNNSGIIGTLGEIEDDFILTFGFKLLIKNPEVGKKEYIIMQFKNINDNKVEFKISILKYKNSFFLNIFDNNNIKIKLFSIEANQYYIISFRFESSNLKVSFLFNHMNQTIKLDIKNNLFKSKDNLLLCVGCDIEPKNKNSQNISVETFKDNNYIFTNRFTGFIGDIHIINSKLFGNNEKNTDAFFIQDNFLKLKGQYGNVFLKSLVKQKSFNEYIIPNKDNMIENNQDEKDFFSTLCNNDDTRKLKLIDNVTLHISSVNFQLINYKDSIDYLNYNNSFHEEEKNLNKYQKEYQYFNNFRIKQNNNTNKIILINTKLFNCHFNIFENKSSLNKLAEDDGIFYLILILEYYYQITFKICKDISEKDKSNNSKENYDNNLSNEQKKILNFIGKGIKNLIIFFCANFLDNNININTNKIMNFYYQINVVIKQYSVIQNLNIEIYDILIYILDKYQNLISQNFNKDLDEKILYIQVRNSFFDFLLNPNFYKKNDLLMKLDILFEKLTQIILANLENNELLKNNIFNKILYFLFIFKLHDNDSNDNKKNELLEDPLYNKIQKKYVNLLINYIKLFYQNQKDNNEIIKIYNKIIQENEYNYNIFYFLSYIIYKSDINPNIKKSLIEILENTFKNNYLKDNNNSKILSISSLLILSEYYKNENQNEFDKIAKFKLLFKNLDTNQIIIYLVKVFNLMLKGTNEFDEIFNNFKQLNNDSININFQKIKSKKEIELFMATLLSLFNEKPKNIVKSFNKENINMFYQTYRNIIFIILKTKYIKNFKNLLSSQNYVCPILFYYKIIYSNKNRKILIQEHINEFNKELTLYHNNPFFFRLIQLLNANISNTIHKIELYDDKGDRIYITKSQENENNKKELISTVISIINSIFNVLKAYKLDKKNKKKNKYYIRGIVNLLISIYNICKLKEIIYFNNKTFLNIFANLVKLLEEINLIYSNYCIKINKIQGKLIVELVYDSFIYFLMTKHENIKQIQDLFNQIFIKTLTKNKNQKSISLFYLLDLLKIPNLDKEEQNQIKAFIKDIKNIKEINSLLETKTNYNLNDFEVRKNLPNYKCIFPINKINFSIFFLCKTFTFIYYKGIGVPNYNLVMFLFKSLIPILNENIRTYKNKYRINFNEEIFRNFELYSIIMNYFNTSIWENSEYLANIKEFLITVLPTKLKSNYEIDSCYSSIFIWKETESEILNNKTELDDNEQNENFELINSRDNKISELEKKNNSDKKETQDLSIEEKMKNIKENLSTNKYMNHYFCFFDDIKNKCFIYNPKNILIKIIFSHIYYNLIFYDKAFMYVKNKYLRHFPTANKFTKQLNYPSKIKNFSNYYEPKIFLRKDCNFYDKIYFPISHDYLFRNKSVKQYVNEDKLFIDKNLSSINFYEHNFNLNDIFEEKEKYFDCELVSSLYNYFGYLIFGNDYIFFGTKDENPPDFRNDKSEDFDLDLFLKFCFTNRIKENSHTKNKSLILLYRDIKIIIKRRMLLMYQAIEIFCNNGKSYFFNLYKKENCDNAFKILNIMNNRDNSYKFKLISENINEEMKIINNQVKNRVINNYLYLTKINFYASRTFNDAEQYPVFPWIILNFDKIDNLLKIEKHNEENIENIIRSSITDEDNRDIITERKKSFIQSNQRMAENQKLYQEFGLRIFCFPVSMQTEDRRENAKFKFREESDGKFHYHHGTHYSASPYVFFFLMRTNPYCQCLIKLQNYGKENPNRLFISYKELTHSFNSVSENRELIPNIFCHFDYYCNLNCDFNGINATEQLIDDLFVNDNTLTNSKNIITEYFKYEYLFRKLLNSNLISKFLPDWIDNIFGKNQLPDNPIKSEESCNVFSKSSYEQKNKLDEKISKYMKKLNNKEITKKKFKTKLLLKIDLLINFGTTPHKVLNNSIKLKTSTIFNNIPNVFCKIQNNIYFIKSNEEILILFKNELDNCSGKIKNIATWYANSNNYLENLDKRSIYPCGYIKNLQKIKYKFEDDNIRKIPIFKPCYSMSKFIFCNKLFILTCRYLGNIFKIQNTEYYIDVLCEDFVSCIICNDNYKNSSCGILIYTGLKNGKLIEWKIKEKLNKYGKISIKEAKNCHCHKGEITCLELYENQNIIITGGIDKMIYIRKTYDFELLSVINLTYLYGNPEIGTKINIVPTLIKASELNCFYIILFNYDTNKSFIRGYNFNGLYFAQTDEDNFMNICFTKNSNLLVSIYNKEIISLLNCYNLEPYINQRDTLSNSNNIFNLEIKDFLKNYNKINKEESDNNYLVWFDYNNIKQEFIFLFNDKIIKGCIEESKKQMEFDYY